MAERARYLLGGGRETRAAMTENTLLCIPTFDVDDVQEFLAFCSDILRHKNFHHIAAQELQKRIHGPRNFFLCSPGRPVKS